MGFGIRLRKFFVSRRRVTDIAPLCLAACLALVMAPEVARAQSSATDTKAATARLAKDSPCLICHFFEEKDLLHTRHGVSGDPRTPWGNGAACEACHGKSEDHAKDFKAKPTVVFNKALPAVEREAPCLACHAGGERIHWAGAGHARNGIACDDCHKSHKPVDPAMVASTSAGVCFDCHQDKRAASLKASTHPVRTGWMPCSSCHNPHGSPGEADLVKTKVNDTCFTCHADKRGPHLWPHAPASESCANCHDAHGTNNPPLLMTRMPFLCKQCHLTPMHGSSLNSGANLPPAVAGASMLGASCANCHVKVHGSNHPSGARLTR